MTRIRALVAALGARPLFLEPVQHDALAALVSHLPYLAATLLLAQAAEAAEKDENVWPVSASGFRDMVRLAGSDPHMLLDIILTNRPAIVAELQQYRARLDDLLALLAGEDAAALAAWLQARQLEHTIYRKGK
jgi:prephenate dehydrogenase